MGTVISLRRARKAKARAEAGVQADANRAAFGRTTAEKVSARTERERRDRTLDGARREE